MYKCLTTPQYQIMSDCQGRCGPMTATFSGPLGDCNDGHHAWNASLRVRMFIYWRWLPSAKTMSRGPATRSATQNEAEARGAYGGCCCRSDRLSLSGLEMMRDARGKRQKEGGASCSNSAMLLLLLLTQQRTSADDSPIAMRPV